ncbi:hypothetical protein HanLR1_Chr01g0031751 [Helianthus annuus]|nr:hypothetical protein HanHA89_Chr01g0033241 [Helianthus annuus]KAJ0784407.1 hypothetical protein HanLR1_Chr01g0031751 [Helianthus annuus]
MCVCVEFKQERNKQNLPLQLHVEIQQIEDEIGQDSYACDEILNHLRVLYIRIGTTLAWTKHERLTGRNEARKRLRTWMHEVSDFRNHFLFCLSNVVLVN